MLRALQQQPSHVEGLLRSLVKSLHILPEYAQAAPDRGELPDTLRKVVTRTTRLGQSWLAWRDAAFHFWLFTADMSLPLSRERGSPVLQVEYYREHGLRESGRWVIDREAKWHRCCD